MPSLSRSLLAAGLLAMGTGALAQPPAHPAGHGRPDGPGHMQPPAKRTELQSMLESRFAQLDVNKDGKLSQDDHAARRSERRDLAFSRLDTDKNGAISKAEFAAAPHDGARMHHAAMNWRGHMARGPMGAGPGPDGQRPDQMGQPITKATFVAQGLARFDKADTNHDGTLSQAERDAARPAMHGRRGPGHMAPPQAPASPKAK